LRVCGNDVPCAAGTREAHASAGGSRGHLSGRQARVAQSMSCAPAEATGKHTIVDWLGGVSATMGISTLLRHLLLAKTLSEETTLS
jgi:hypothetical protein